jgi:NAD(P)-dependent dehydrogenase (short-subunit alcohol dehydrogenase family)
VDLSLNNQNIIVTGSSRGIGKSIANAFLREGASVVLTGRDQASLKITVDLFKESYDASRVMSFSGDLQASSKVRELVEFVEGELGTLDHLVCNIGSGRSVPPLQEDVSEWRRMLDINLLSASACVHFLLPLLEKKHTVPNSHPSIILIASICGVEALGAPTVYASAKTALIAYAKSISRPLGRRGIRVNVVSPGNIVFPGSTWEDKISHDSASVEAMLDREVPLNRLGTPEEVAGVVVFLASRQASFVAGANWIVDGGQTRSY